MKRKVTIIGAGSVGATIAFTMANDTIASEILLIDINKEKAEGEVMDIMQGTAFRDPITVTSGDYCDAVGSDIVIISSGISRKPGQTRIDLTKTNVGIMKSIAPEIAKYAPNAIYIIVSNPVDILTYVFTKESGIPENQIIGSGTMLDTARLRSTISDRLGIAKKNIHAYIFGEHGDTSFVPWSIANISGISVDDYCKLIHPEANEEDMLDKEEIIDYVRTSGGQIIKRKGATFYAIAVSVCRICKTILGSQNSIITVSSMMHGEYGIEDVCLSVSCVVGPKGLEGRVTLPLTEEEVEKLHVSANALKDVIRQIEE